MNEGPHDPKSESDIITVCVVALFESLHHPHFPLCVWLVSGKTAPRLITKDMVDLLRPGAVTVDLAAEVSH
jgi:alanine dehydrogenase